MCKSKRKVADTQKKTLIGKGWSNYAPPSIHDLSRPINSLTLIADAQTKK